MRLKLMWVMLLGAAIVAITAQYTKPVLATSAAGFVGTTLARGRFGDINVFSHLVPPGKGKSQSGSDVWLSLQKTKGLSDVYVQSNVWAPAGSTGWHTHPGHSLIIVTAGTVTTYEGDDPECSSTRVHGWDGNRRSRRWPRAQHQKRRYRGGAHDHCADDSGRCRASDRRRGSRALPLLIGGRFASRRSYEERGRARRVGMRIYIEANDDIDGVTARAKFRVLRSRPSRTTRSGVRAPSRSPSRAGLR